MVEYGEFHFPGRVGLRKETTDIDCMPQLSFLIRREGLVANAVLMHGMIFSYIDDVNAMVFFLTIPSPLSQRAEPAPSPTDVRVHFRAISP
jgi:hypothetical protein